MEIAMFIQLYCWKVIYIVGIEITSESVHVDFIY